MSDEPEVFLSLWRGLILAPGTTRYRGPRSYYRITGPVLADVLASVQAVTSVTPAEIMGRRRRQRIARARQMAMFLLREITRDGFPKYSYPEIGRALGGLDHNTVQWGCRRHAERFGVIHRTPHRGKPPKLLINPQPFAVVHSPPAPEPCDSTRMEKEAA